MTRCREGQGAENYFYRPRELSPEDVDFLRAAIISDSPEGLKASHEHHRPSVGP
jgi:hypothetical protein